MAINPLTKAVRQIRRSTLIRDGAGRTDAQLLASFIEQRDEAAFAALVRLHAPMVWGVCRRALHSHHDAEDAFQATFLVLLRKASSIVPREMVGNWLYGVAYRTTLKARMIAAKRRGRESPMRNMPDPETVPEERFDLQPLLDQELSRLPDKYRVPIVLCDLEGKTQKEAARQVGVPEGTLSARLVRARAMLAKRLVRHGFAGSVAALGTAFSAGAASATVPAPVVCSTIKAASLLAAGNGAAASVISPTVSTLVDGVLKVMLLNKLTKMTVLIFLLSAATFGGLHLSVAVAAQRGHTNEPRAEGAVNAPSAPKKDSEKNGSNAAMDKEGSFRGVVEKVDADGGVITVSRIAPPTGGRIGPATPNALGGIVYMRLENLPVAKDARILVGGKQAQLADVKAKMRIVLELEVKGGIKIKEIEAEDVVPIRPMPGSH